MIDPASVLATLPGRLYQDGLAKGQPLRALISFAAVMIAIVRDIAFGQLLLRATSLVYTTLLSIVPMLALTFSLSKAFGVHGQIEPALQQFLEPLGPRGQEISNQIIGFINNMHVGVLGSVGLAMLFFTAISTILKIESAINNIWHVRQLRPISHRISGYLSILLLGPIVVFSSLGINAAIASSSVVQSLIAIEPFGELAIQAGKLVPYVLIIALFLLLYLYMPNTRVRFIPALVSALVAGIAWQSAGWGFARFVANSSQYDAIYSGFAILILFMIWLYVSWVVVLLGASVGFYLQHPEYLQVGTDTARLSDQNREQLGLALMQDIAARHLQGGPPLTTTELSERYLMPAVTIERLLDALTQSKLLLTIEQSQPPAWTPARDIGQISVWQVLESIREAGELNLPNPPEGRVNQAFRDAEAQMASTLSTVSLRELLVEEARLPGHRPMPPATHLTSTEPRIDRLDAEAEDAEPRFPEALTPATPLPPARHEVMRPADESTEATPIIPPRRNPAP
ncbi:MAG: YhjD/YihY/BrkB family envelope integrity protein [Lautropia sp.]|nr:YhjD/YihY/BrkB family envelope integrity protein [Lautropia sp.]